MNPDPKAQLVGAHAPSPEFVSPTPYTGQWGDTLVIYCTDPRFRRQTHDFLHDHLRLEHPAVVTIPAGVAPLLPLVGFAHKLAKGWMDMLVRNHRPTRIVCVGHQDCAGYKAVKHPVLSFMLEKVTGASAADLQKKHLRDAKATLGVWFPGVAVEVYYAELRQEGGSQQVVFTAIT